MTNFVKIEQYSSINNGFNTTDTPSKEKLSVHSFKLKRKSELNKIIVDAANKPDYLAINIYFDTLRSWYTPKKIHRIDGTITHVSKLKTKGIYFSYKKLADSYGCSTETIRKKLVKLEKLGLIQRSFQHRSNAVTNSYNQLIVYVWKITPHFFNEFGINREEVSNLVPQTNHKYIAEKYNIDYNSQSQSDKDIEGRWGIHKIEGTKKLIELFSKEKNRSIESNFLESNFGDKKSSFSKNTVSLPRNKVKHLKDFYPLQKEDCYLLQNLSGREFGLTAMNEILKDMSRRLTDKIFYNKNSFIAYMSKAFQYELRDAVKTSSETFRIRSNVDEKDRQIAKEEKYLSEIESCLQVSPEWHFKKKLASVLDRSRAYALLTSYKRIELGKGSNVGRCILHMQKQINLTQNEKEIILNQVNATHELVGKGGEYKSVQEIELVYPKRSSQFSVNQDPDIEVQSQCKYKCIDQDHGLWGKIRQIFIKTEGEHGKALDNHWISRLDVKIDDQAKKVELFAPSEFVKSYVEEKLLKSISYSVNQIGFELRSIEC